MLKQLIEVRFIHNHMEVFSRIILMVFMAERQCGSNESGNEQGLHSDDNVSPFSIVRDKMKLIE